jgi:hypothetical protein
MMNCIIYYIAFLPLQIHPNKYITGTLNKGQPLHRGKGRNRGRKGRGKGRGKDGFAKEEMQYSILYNSSYFFRRG